MFEIKTPVYINTTFNHFCDGCEESDLVLNNGTMYEWEKPLHNYYILTCKNYETCKRLMHYLRGVKRETD